jgi:hypothetical protein
MRPLNLKGGFPAMRSRTRPALADPLLSSRFLGSLPRSRRLGEATTLVPRTAEDAHISKAKIADSRIGRRHHLEDVRFHRTSASSSWDGIGPTVNDYSFTATPAQEEALAAWYSTHQQESS